MPSPAVAPVPATAVASPALSIAAVAPASSGVVQYQNISDFPATANSSAYSTASVPLNVANTTLEVFDGQSQVTLLNSINQYVRANGYSNFYLGFDSVSLRLQLLCVLSIKVCSHSELDCADHNVQDVSVMLCMLAALGNTS